VTSGTFLLELTFHVYFYSHGSNINFNCSFTREKMVAALLSAGANPSLVTDPTPDAPGGYTASDLAARQGFDGLAAYLAEKGLTAHFEAMSLSKDTGRSPSRTKSIKQQTKEFETLSEQEICLKESLAAYRNAADAANNIQAALRERTLNLRTKAIQLTKPENEAAAIVAAMRIQHAFRNYNRKKVLRAAARIQSHFRTWKIRRDFMNMRRQVIKIQVSFCMIFSPPLPPPTALLIRFVCVNTG
jgi:calmodulin-binding transcription activator